MHRQRNTPNHSSKFQLFFFLQKMSEKLLFLTGIQAFGYLAALLSIAESQKHISVKNTREC